MCLFITLAVPGARAQQSPDLSALVAEAFKALEKSKTRTVAVFDFYGPEISVFVLGRSMADQFSTGLSNSSSGIAVIDRARGKDAIESNRFAPAMIADPEIAMWLAQGLYVESAAIGRLSLSDGTLQLNLHLFQARNGKMLGSFCAKFPLTESLKGLMETNADPDSGLKSEKEVTHASGFSMPACVYCPNPNSPRGPKRTRFKGLPCWMESSVQTAKCGILKSCNAFRRDLH